MWFDSWGELGRILVVGCAGYASLVVMVRIAGKRTLAKMTAFDFVVTVALGSTLATLLLSEQVALAEGVLALALLIGLQYLVAWGSVRSTAFSKAIHDEPRLVFYEGRFLEGSLRRERITRAEVQSAMRQAGYRDPGQVLAVVVETAGELALVPRANEPPAALLTGVRE